MASTDDFIAIAHPNSPVYICRYSIKALSADCSSKYEKQTNIIEVLVTNSGLAITRNPSMIHIWDMKTLETKKLYRQMDQNLYIRRNGELSVFQLGPLFRFFPQNSINLTNCTFFNKNISIKLKVDDSKLIMYKYFKNF